MALYDDILRESMMAGRAARRIGMEDDLMGASVVNRPNPMYQSYNPAGAYAEAGRTVPNYASDWARGMNQVTQPFGGVPSDLHGAYSPLNRDPQTGEDLGWMDYDPAAVHFRADLPPKQGQVDEQGYIGPYGRPDLAAEAQARRDAIFGTSVVAPPRIPTEKETLDRGVMGPVNERDAAFSKIHSAYYTGADFGYEQGWPEHLGVPAEYIDIYMAVPDEAKQYAHDNPTPEILQQFEEKYGFPLDVSVEISM